MGGGGVRAYAVILSKGVNGKSRLRLSPEATRLLQTSLVRDIHQQLAATGRFERVLVASPDRSIQDFCASEGITALPLGTRDLNRSLRDIQEYGTREGYAQMFLTASDLPFFSVPLVEVVLERLDGLLRDHPAGAVFCPSREMGVTVCCASPPMSVRLRVEPLTPNLLVLDEVAGTTPFELLVRLESYNDLDRPEHLEEAFLIMEGDPELRTRSTFDFLRTWLFREKRGIPFPRPVKRRNEIVLPVR
jgi:2-phospho-L-lactate guanylyltransferase (CobY/MobA/RfbA family)